MTWTWQGGGHAQSTHFGVPASEMDVTLGFTVAIGNTVCAGASFDATNPTSGNVTDSLGNVYTKVVSTKDTTNSQFMELWVSVVTVAGTPTVKLTFNPTPGTTTSSSCWFVVDVFTGSDSRSFVDGIGSGNDQLNPGSGTDACVSGTWATTHDGDLIYGWVVSDPTPLAGTGFTIATGSTIDGFTAQSAWNAQGTHSSSTQITFTASGGGTGPLVTQGMAITPATATGSPIQAVVYVRQKIQARRPARRHIVLSVPLRLRAFTPSVGKPNLKITLHRIAHHKPRHVQTAKLFLPRIALRTAPAGKPNFKITLHRQARKHKRFVHTGKVIAPAFPRPFAAPVGKPNRKIFLHRQEPKHRRRVTTAKWQASAIRYRASIIIVPPGTARPTVVDVLSYLPSTADLFAGASGLNLLNSPASSLALLTLPLGLTILSSESSNMPNLVQPIKQGDTSPALAAQLGTLNPDGTITPDNLTSCTVVVNIRLDGILVVTGGACSITDAVNGKVSYPWGPNDTAKTGTALAEFKSTDGSLKVKRYPDTGNFKINIVPQVGP